MPAAVMFILLFILTVVSAQSDCEFCNRSYSFIVDQNTHQITFNMMDEWFQMDQYVFVFDQTMSWESIASISLQVLDVKEIDYVDRLANALKEMNDSVRNVVLEKCQLHLIHGGIGVLAEEDFHALRMDHCCDEVAEELFMFYLGYIPS